MPKRVMGVVGKVKFSTGPLLLKPLTMEFQKLLIKLTKEPAYLRYGQMNLVIRSVPGEQIEFYSKIKGGAEHKLLLSLEVIKTAIRDCVEISREEYESF